MKKLTLKDFQNRLDIIYPHQKLIAIEWGGDKKDTTVKCGICGQVYTKLGGYFLRKKAKSVCKNCFPTQPNQLKTDWQPSKDYELLSVYQGMHHKVTIKHLECGFIWNITPANLKLGKGCPKCNKVKSKGEQKIEEYLINNNINYVFQYPLNIEMNHYRIDFYLPDLDKYIEYNGEQHFKAIEFFGGEERLKQQQERDKKVAEVLKDKLIIISYLDFENIENILKSSTTIPQGSTL